MQTVAHSKLTYPDVCQWSFNLRRQARCQHYGCGARMHYST